MHRPMGWTKEEDQLWDAARDGKDGEIERLIDAGTHVDCAHPNRSDTTPLMTAARYANLSSVKLLLSSLSDAFQLASATHLVTGNELGLG